MAVWTAGDVPTRLLYFLLVSLLLATAATGVYFFLVRRGSEPKKAPTAGSKYTVSEQPLYTSNENRRKVIVFFPEDGGFELVSREREIYATSSMSNQMKQIIVELIKGPKEGEDGALHRALPEATRLREVYLSGQTAYVDLTRDLLENIDGGSRLELLTIYSIVDSITYNFGEIRSVKILVEGAEIETLSGHVDLRRALTKDMAYVRPSGPGA